MPETTLVTGSAGFIGCHTVLKLLSQGNRVVGLDNLNDYYDPGLKQARLKMLEGKEGYTHVEGNIEDRDLVADLFNTHGFTNVVHLAAQAGVRYSIENPFAYIDSNINGFITILEGCRHHKVEHLVYASSSSVYGLNALMPFSESHGVNHPVSLYAATKKSNELMAHCYSQLYALPTTGLRFFTVYGPWGRPDMALFLFTRAILEGEPIKVFNHGKMKRDFTYVDDIVEGVTRVLRKPAAVDPKWDAHDPAPNTSSCPYTVYNIGNHTPVELGTFITVLEAKLGIEAKKEMLPMQPGDVPSTTADVRNLFEAVGYTPSTPVEEGIANFVDWYRSYYGA